MEINKISELLVEMDYQVPPNLEEHLLTYKKMLYETNKQFNLTAVSDEEVIEKHFYDCALILKTSNFNNKTIMDVGSGAGFPGLVLKILVPTIKILLVEPTQKRCNFLNEVIEKLGLKGIEVLAKRAEELEDTYREAFDIVVSRAVSNLRMLLELCVPYVKVGGYFIPMKGKAGLEEVVLSSIALSKLNTTLVDSFKEVLPSDNALRYNLKFIKNKKTENKYPRFYPQIKKNPL